MVSKKILQNLGQFLATVFQPSSRSRALRATFRSENSSAPSIRRISAARRQRRFVKAESVLRTAKFMNLISADFETLRMIRPRNLKVSSSAESSLYAGAFFSERNRSRTQKHKSNASGAEIPSPNRARRLWRDSLRRANDWTLKTFQARQPETTFRSQFVGVGRGLPEPARFRLRRDFPLTNSSVVPCSFRCSVRQDSSQKIVSLGMTKRFSLLNCSSEAQIVQIKLIARKTNQVFEEMSSEVRGSTKQICSFSVS